MIVAFLDRSCEAIDVPKKSVHMKRDVKRSRLEGCPSIFSLGAAAGSSEQLEEDFFKTIY